MYIQLTQDRLMESITNCTKKAEKNAPAQDSSHLGGVLPRGETNSINVSANME